MLLHIGRERSIEKGVTFYLLAQISANTLALFLSCTLAFVIYYYCYFLFFYYDFFHIFIEVCYRSGTPRQQRGQARRYNGALQFVTTPRNFAIPAEPAGHIL